MDSTQQISKELQNIIDQVMTVITTYGLDVLGAVTILIIGWIAAGWSKRATASALSRIKIVDAMLTSFFSSMVQYAVLAFAVVAMLDRFGVETTSFVAVIGAAGLAIGFALQGTLSNVAAGVMMLLFRPYKVGDFIEGAGMSGTVKALSLFTTEMATGDNIHIFIPNAKLWGDCIRNFSHNPKRRVDLLIGIGYGDDIDQATDIIKRLSAQDERIHTDPEPFVEVSGLGDSSVDLVVRVWTDTPNYWPVKFALTKAIKQTFDKEGVSFPFPQRDVHIHQA